MKKGVLGSHPLPAIRIAFSQPRTGYGLIVNVVFPCIDPRDGLDVAVIVGAPVALIEASPGVAGVTNVTAGRLELHVTELVRFCVLLSEKVPVAVNPKISPT